MFVRLCRWVLPAAIVLAALAAYRVTISATVPPIPTSGFSADRELPWRVPPRYDIPPIADDDQLAAVLQRMLPPAVDPEKRNANTNYMVHALRLWGPHAEFDRPEIPSGPEMLAYFLDDAVFRRLAGEQTPALFELEADGGVVVREWEDGDRFNPSSSHHTDDLLATFGESRTPFDTPLRTRNGDATVRNLLESSLRRFHLERHEYEWSSIAYARCVFPQAYRNKFGEVIDGPAVIEELIAAPHALGPCNGLHRLEALVVLDRIDDQANALPRRARERLRGHLAEVSRLLVAAQHDDGSWTRNWPLGAAARAPGPDTKYDRILVTGHHLEWLALAPPELLPPRETLVRAGQWLVRAMLEESDSSLLAHYGPFSHSARALCLWRSKEPFDVWRAAQTPAAE